MIKTKQKHRICLLPQRKQNVVHERTSVCSNIMNPHLERSVIQRTLRAKERNFERKHAILRSDRISSASALKVMETGLKTALGLIAFVWNPDRVRFLLKIGYFDNLHWNLSAGDLKSGSYSRDLLGIGTFRQVYLSLNGHWQVCWLQLQCFSQCQIGNTFCLKWSISWCQATFRSCSLISSNWLESHRRREKQNFNLTSPNKVLFLLLFHQKKISLDEKWQEISFNPVLTRVFWWARSVAITVNLGGPTLVSDQHHYKANDTLHIVRKITEKSKSITERTSPFVTMMKNTMSLKKFGNKTLFGAERKKTAQNDWISLARFLSWKSVVAGWSLTLKLKVIHTFCT